MKSVYEQLLHLLRIFINGEIPDKELLASVDGVELYNQARLQGVSSFLFETVYQHNDLLKIDHSVLTHWKEKTVVTAARQLMMLPTIGTIFNLFETNGITAISLKGLVFKEQYPRPELRSMNDLDVLINEKQMNQCIEAMTSLGYKPNELNYNDPDHMHIDMIKAGTFAVELHRTLWHPKYMQKIDNSDWVDHIWKDKRLQTVAGFQFYCLSPEDELINAVIHTARHLKHSNANLRLLSDFVLFFNSYRNQIDINYIEQTLESMAILNFYYYLMDTCRLYLGLHLPDNYQLNSTKNSVIIIQNIMNKEEMIISSDRDQEKKVNGYQYLLQKIKLVISNSAIYNKLLKIVHPFRSKARFLRKIGLHFRY
ncbi:MAG: nucleotidyltransferase family protein [Dehalobacter sp. 4CP]|uniref:nucleotidyltransferase domain-containing protein n=1 Tax=Dehalobacter sp. CP TaxID=2594474 RepID=UPI0013CCA84A|nr:nucleotidyltransferase family protein [Dehalobacter sp. 4CP]